MKAVGLYRYLPVDHAESLIDVEIPKPEATGHDLLVKVEAISVNPVDFKVRAPKDTVEKTPRVLGWDAAGTVAAVGPDVTLFKVGDPVFYAEALRVQARTANTTWWTSASSAVSLPRSTSRMPQRCP